ncbi:DNA primase [Imtechella halotolerans K1]|uniref:DNA primase n=2 Tax=Imtechella TaxID=1165076 RepID=I0WCD1_9FLAO|nr:DNA primase [Imtechella halotolerans K1]
MNIVILEEFHQNIKILNKTIWLMKKEILNCEKARSICIVLTLAKLGHFPKRKSEKEAWFLSPFRSETQASLKVSLKENYWIDFGSFEGGNVIDLVVKLKHCSVKDALIFLSGGIPNFSFHQQTILKQRTGKIEILKILTIQHLFLINFLKSRKILVSFAQNYCKEVWYNHNGKTFFAIGLENHLGGWELRNKYFKSSTSPKTFSLIPQGSDHLIVTEGMFDLLSLESLLNESLEGYDLMILNSLAFTRNISSYLKSYKTIKLYLDYDDSGSKATEYLLKIHSQAIDCRAVYKGYKDANEKLIS